jgi:Putative zinc-finger
MNTGSQNGHIEHAHLNEEWIRKYQSKSLAAEELEAAGRHLSDCGSCRRVVLERMGPVRLPEELSELPEPLHLSYEQITAYIDDKLGGADRERVDAHTFICASCSREIEDLRKLDAMLAEPEAEVKTEPARVSLWERLAQAFRVPGAVPKFGMALGAVVLGVFLLLPLKFGGGGGGGDIDNLVRRAGSASPGLSFGGLALVVGGVLYIVYRLLRRR